MHPTVLATSRQRSGPKPAASPTLPEAPDKGTPSQPVSAERGRPTTFNPDSYVSHGSNVFTPTAALQALHSSECATQKPKRRGRIKRFFKGDLPPPTDAQRVKDLAHQAKAIDDQKDMFVEQAKAYRAQIKSCLDRGDRIGASRVAKVLEPVQNTILVLDAQRSRIEKAQQSLYTMLMHNQTGKVVEMATGRLDELVNESDSSMLEQTTAWDVTLEQAGRDPAQIAQASLACSESVDAIVAGIEEEMKQQAAVDRVKMPEAVHAYEPLPELELDF